MMMTTMMAMMKMMTRDNSNVDDYDPEDDDELL